MKTPWPEPITLQGEHACLRPLAREHAPGLARAAQDGERHRLWYTTVPAPEAMAAEIERRLGLQAQGSMLPWTVFDAAGVEAGTDIEARLGAGRLTARVIRRES